MEYPNATPELHYIPGSLHDRGKFSILTAKQRPPVKHMARISPTDESHTVLIP
jgi:hypothetical protein